MPAPSKALKSISYLDTFADCWLQPWDNYSVVEQPTTKTYVIYSSLEYCSHKQYTDELETSFSVTFLWYIFLVLNVMLSSKLNRMLHNTNSFIPNLRVLTQPGI